MDRRDPAKLANGNYRGALLKSLRAEFPGAGNPQGAPRRDQHDQQEVSFVMRDMVLADPSIIGTTHGVWVKIIGRYRPAGQRLN